MARPSKLTPEVQAAICEAIRHGATYEAAAEAAGIAYDTFNNWHKDTRPRFIKFFEAVKRANADAQLDLLAKIDSQADKDWRAAAWILERRFKKDFGTAVDLTSGGEAIKVVVEYVDAGNQDDQAAETSQGAASDQA